MSSLRRLGAALLTCAALSAGATAGGCAQPSKSAVGADAAQGGGQCPQRAAAPDALPGTPADRADLSYWLAQAGETLDRALLGIDGIASYNAMTGRKPGDDPFAQRDLLAAVDTDKLAGDIAERLQYVSSRVTDGSSVGAGGVAVSAADARAFAAKPQWSPPTVHVATAETPIRCGPLGAALFKPDDLDFDRNACSTIRAQEPVQQLGLWPGGMRLVRTRYAMGWVSAAAPLSPPLTPERAAAVVGANRLRASRELSTQSPSTRCYLWRSLARRSGSRPRPA